jgi:hypothetical protein
VQQKEGVGIGREPPRRLERRQAHGFWGRLPLACLGATATTMWWPIEVKLAFPPRTRPGHGIHDRSKPLSMMLEWFSQCARMIRWRVK